jgi:hypothetical protein
MEGSDAALALIEAGQHRLGQLGLFALPRAGASSLSTALQSTSTS